MLKYLIIAVLFLVFVFLGLGHWEKSDKSRRKKLGIVFLLFFLWIRYNLVFIERLMRKGTKFQRKVWRYLMKIPRGTVKSYIEVAKGINMPLSVRAKLQMQLVGTPILLAYHAIE